MALKVKAVEILLRFLNNPNDPGVYRYVMKPEMYSSLAQTKVIKEAAMRSGVSQGVMKACWDAAGEVIKAWATEGHSVALPGFLPLSCRASTHALSCRVHPFIVISTKRKAWRDLIDL